MERGRRQVGMKMDLKEDETNKGKGNERNDIERYKIFL